MSFLKAHQDVRLCHLQLTGLSLLSFYVSRLIKYLLFFLTECLIKLLLLLLLDTFGALLGLHLYLDPSHLICLSIGFLDHEFSAGENLALFFDHGGFLSALMHDL